MTYSVDFRQKVLFIRQRDELTLQAAADRFDVGVATIVRWNKQLEPKASRDRSCPKITDEALLADVEQYPDAYQYERAERLNASASGIGKALKRCGISRKKRR